MASWNEFEREASELAERGRALWKKNVLMYLATTRLDGSPRVHPVVPILMNGGMYLAIPDWSPKWKDLERDARCVLHALPGDQDDEFVLRCRALPREDARAAVAEAADHVIDRADHIFEFDLEQVDLGYWENVGQPDTYSVRHRWVPGKVSQLKPS